MNVQRGLCALALGLFVSSAFITAGIAAPKARLTLPKPKLAAGQAYSPHTVVVMLAKKKYRVLELYRKGQAYAAVAMNANGDKVQMTVDGASGQIVGLAVILPAPHKGKPGKPKPTQRAFGAIIPKAAFSHWPPYRAADWRKPAAATMPIKPSYAPYREALPYTYYVPLRAGQDYVPIVPPGYAGYDLYDPYGQALNNAWDAADNAEYNAALEAERANYEAARADATGAENAALRDELDAINNEPPPNYDPAADSADDDSIAPETGEDLSEIPDDNADNSGADDHDDNADNSGADDHDNNDDNSGADNNSDDSHDNDDNDGGGG